jgi:16S rRNA processing protein RimM
MAGRRDIGSNAISIDDLQQVAQVLKSNGTDGELVLGFRDIAPEDINLEEPVFIVFDGLPVPFFIESFSKRGNTKALVHLTDVCSMEDVEEIAGKAVYITSDSIPEMTLEEDGYAALVGWMVLTPTEDGDGLIEVGEITDFMDIPNNPCLAVETVNGEVILPLHEDFILSLDPEYQEIIMQIPAGLI